MDSENNGRLDAKTFAIGVLSITAAILLVGVIIIGSTPRNAVADGIGSEFNDFTIAVGKVGPDEGALYVIDNVSQQLLTYTVERKTGAVKLSDKYSLAIQPPASGNQPGSSGSGSRRGGRRR